MPWKVASMASEKQKFIDLYETGKFTKTELCSHFNITRPTGDAIIKRFHEEGYEALNERTRRPHTYPNQTPKSMEDALVEKRKQFHWGV